MTEEKLKTLKDFETEYERREIAGEHQISDTLVSTIELREEAKKWISRIQAKIKEKEDKFDNFGFDLGMEYTEKGEAIIGFITLFFNITEEEL